MTANLDFPIHIASGGIAPSIGFAKRILAGWSIDDAHRAEKAFLFDGVEPACKVCRDIKQVLVSRSDPPQFVPCKGCQ